MNKMTRPCSFAKAFEHGFEALFELAAILGAGYQGAHVEHEHALILQILRYLFVDDAQR